nr:hypothetical protein [Luteibacter rhizovicinus]
MSKIYSYVVRYDSGFAPNPFYGYCTLATCKPKIRTAASNGDWLIGCGSDALGVRRGGHLVYAMRVTETLSFDEYSFDERFSRKIPYRYGSRKQSCGDNIYFRDQIDGRWRQRDSFHSRVDGSPSQDHINRDTSVNRVLISSDFVYFGGDGPAIPATLKDSGGRPLAKTGIGFTSFDDDNLLHETTRWLDELGVRGFQAPPFEWITIRQRSR